MRALLYIAAVLAAVPVSTASTSVPPKTVCVVCWDGSGAKAIESSDAKGKFLVNVFDGAGNFLNDDPMTEAEAYTFAKKNGILP